METEKKCYLACSCENSYGGNTYTRCNYGSCCGYKCQSCGEWIEPQYGASCAKYTIPKANTPEGEVQILSEEVLELKSRIALRNRQIRDLRRAARK